MKRSLYFLLITGQLLFNYAHAQSKAEINWLKQRIQNSQADSNRVNLLLELAHSYVIRPGDFAIDLDTALLLSRQAYGLSRSLGYLKGQGLSYLLTAQANREKGNKQLGMQLNKRAIDLLATSGTLENQADAYIEQAGYYTVSRQDLIQQVCLYDRAISLLQRSGNKLKLADAVKYRGDLYQLQSNNVQGLKDLLWALSLYRSIGYTHLQEIYDLLGFVYSKVGDYEEGVKYGLLAMQTVEAVKDTVKLAKVYSRLGNTYHELNQPEKAFIYYDKSLRCAQTQHRKSTIIVLATTISAILDNYTGETVKRLRIEEALVHLQEIIKIRPADRNDIDCRMAIATCYVNYYSKFSHDYAKAQPYSAQLEAMLQTNLGQDYHLYIYQTLIPFYLSTKQYRKARLLLNTNDTLCQQSHYSKELAINHLWWFKLDSLQADYASAIKHYQLYSMLNDSLINETTKQRTALFEVQYETQEKEKKINGLRQEGKLQEIKIQKAESTRNFIIIGAVMLILLLCLGYNRYLLKQRSNQQLEAKQILIDLKNQSLQQVVGEKDKLLEEKEQLLEEREWMLKEIHHRVKNNLQVISSMLHSQVESLHDPIALATLRESQNRVQVMALIHQKLYQSDNLARIGMRDYIRQIVEYLIESFDRKWTVRAVCTITDVDFDVSLATPLGLIINEALTNSLKYAFPQNRKGTVIISLRALENQRYRLTMRDDGIGAPPDFDLECSHTLGLTMIRGLSRQIEGELNLSQLDGVEITLDFSIY